MNNELIVILSTEYRCLKCGNIKKIEQELSEEEVKYHLLGIHIEKDAILFCKDCDMNTVQKAVSVNSKPKENENE